MGDFSIVRGTEPDGVFSTATAIGTLNSTSPSASAWPAANLAIFVPIRVPYRLTVYRMVIGGGTAGGNFDVGIYSAAGAKLVSSGAVAKSSSAPNFVNIADTVIGPGLYYLAMSADGTNSYYSVLPSGTSPVPVQKCRLYGLVQMASAYTLPATATFAAVANAVVPLIAAYTRPY